MAVFAQGVVVSLENACYYTFSTVCQTLAGAFGFLVAVVLYRMQSLGATLGVLAVTTIHGRDWERSPPVREAFDRRDWLQLADALRGMEFPSRFPQDYRDAQTRSRDEYVALADQIKLLKQDLRKVLLATGWVIAINLVFLALTPVINHLGIAGFFWRPISSRHFAASLYTTIWPKGYRSRHRHRPDPATASTGPSR
jgi:hypothetical protein